ncbi:MAG: prephenate dehydratase, partial [Desulfobacterales bacterium]
AIASALCAELYNLEIIKEGIEDGPSNSTRFLLLSREPFSGSGDKTSIIFAVSHEAGSLFGVLKLFAEAGINLTRISSMPLRTDPGNYSFFLDFEGSEKDENIAKVLKQVEAQTISIKYIGSYPADSSAG